MWFGVHLGGHLEFWKCQAGVIITPNGFLNYMVCSTQKRKETIVNRHCKVLRKNWSVPLDYSWVLSKRKKYMSSYFFSPSNSHTIRDCRTVSGYRSMTAEASAINNIDGRPSTIVYNSYGARLFATENASHRHASVDSCLWRKPTTLQ